MATWVTLLTDRNLTNITHWATTFGMLAVRSDQTHNHTHTHRHVIPLLKSWQAVHIKMTQEALYYFSNQNSTMLKLQKNIYAEVHGRIAAKRRGVGGS